MYSMLDAMLADVEKELAASGADEGERLARERHAYGLAATELVRQLKSENKLRASLIERILQRSWGLVDASLPAVKEHAASRKAAWVARDALRVDLTASEEACRGLRERCALTEISLWTARRKHAASEVQLFAEKQEHVETRRQVRQRRRRPL